MKWDTSKGQWQRSPEDGPPDLDQIIKNFFKGSSTGPSSNSTSPVGKLGVVTIFVIALIYILSGFYVVLESESAVCLRLGKIHEVLDPGLHWRARGLEHIYIINTQTIDTFKKESTMLTEDENMVYAGFEIQYRRKDILPFLFKDQSPIVSLHQLTESCIRDVIGHSTLDEILTTGKQDITFGIKDLIKQSLMNYQLGIEVLDVNLSFALPPPPVQAAFNEVIKAREDEQAYQNEALRYREDQLPIAAGQEQRILLEAQGYSKEKIFRAQAETQAFALLAEQEQLSPLLTRKRLYYEAIEIIMKNPRKILVDPTLSTPLLSLGSLGAGSSGIPNDQSLEKGGK